MIQRMILSWHTSLLAIALLAMSLPLHSQTTGTPAINLYTPQHTEALPKLPLTGYTSINQSSQTLLTNHHGNKRMPPASLTKLMTLFIAYDYLEKGLIRETDPVLISKKAWKTEGSRMFLEPGTHEPVSLLLQGISVVSGNDASVAIAEHIAGTEEQFVKLMNQKAAELQLSNTNFENATGLPSPHHYSTPYDMSLIGIHLVNAHPQVLEHTKIKTMTYGKIKQDNRNRLLWKDETVYGLKTGHTQEAGYCLVAAAERDGQTIIATVFGAKSEKLRDTAVIQLLNHAQNRYKNVSITHDQKIPDLRVWFSKLAHIKPVLKHSVHLSVPRNANHRIRTRIVLSKHLKAPLLKGQEVGSYSVFINDELVKKVPLITQDTVELSGMMQQLYDWASLQGIYVYQLLTGAQ